MSKNRLVIALEQNPLPKIKTIPSRIYTIDQYNTMLDAGYYIKDGLWYADGFNSIGKAHEEEIAIAALFYHNDYDKPKLIKYNRLGFLNK